MLAKSLSVEESLFYRDRLRSARYAALADAEGFSEICFAVEALGIRLLEKQATLALYKQHIADMAQRVTHKDTLAKDFPGCFTRFDALYSAMSKARNDAMHTGAYARHATLVAVELCIYLEEALMAAPQKPSKVSDYMVRSVVVVEPWQPVAHARQLMLTHSFSFLPVYVDNGWKLLSELSVARFLSPSLSRNQREVRLGTKIQDAKAAVDSLCLLPAVEVKADSSIDDLLDHTKCATAPTLWLVPDDKNRGSLQGVLTPFELM